MIYKDNLTQFPANADYEFLANQSGRILYATSALRGLLGEDICSRNLNDILPDEQAAELLKACANNKPLKFSGKLCNVAVNCEMEPREGDLIISVAPASPVGVPSISAATAELLSREMNINLGTMFITLDNYVKKLPESERHNRELAVVNRGLYQMMRLARNMLDTSLFEEGKMVLHKRYEDLQELCQKIADQTAVACKALGIGFEFISAEENLIFRFDQERVERVIMNLLCNAMQYTKDGNFITFKLLRRENIAVIIVADCGMGISASVLPEVFSKHAFADASSPESLGGAGFGFAIAKAVSHLHSGTCLISSTPNVGTTVTLTIPCDGIDTSFASPKPPDYAGGKSHSLLEFSTILPLEFY